MARKPADDDDEDDDLDDVEPAAEEETAAPADDDGEPVEYEDEDEDGEGRGGGLGRLIIMGAVAFAFIVGVGAGGYFFFLRGDDEAEVAAPADSAAIDPGDGTMMSIPRRRMMTAEELSKKGGDSVAAQPAAAPAATPGGAFTPPPASPAPQAAPQPSPQPQAVAAAPVAPEPPPVEAAPKGPAPAKGKGKAAPAAVGEPSGAGLVMPSVTAAAYRDIPILPQGKPLTGPIASLIESTDAGQLPKIQGSLASWKSYARPFEAPAGRPRIAIIVAGLGLSRTPTLAAVNQLPGGITLAFDAYAKNVDEWVGVGRSNGHEALMHLPLEANDFPVSDPGPLALLTDFDAIQNLGRMHQVLASAIGYVGVMQVMGSRFATSEAAMRPVLEETKRRGLMFISVPTTNDDRGFAIAQEISLPVAQVDLKIDAVASASAIDARLTELEKMARDRGSAIGIAEALPVTIAKLAAWSQTLDFKELVLAPVTAVASVNAPPAPAGAKGGAKK